MTVRKNFTLPDRVAAYLEYLAKKEGKNQSQIIRELIEEKITREQRIQNLEKIEKLSGIFTGLFPDEMTVQKIKSEKDV